MNGRLSRTTWVIFLIVWGLALGFLAVLAEGFVPKTMRQVLLAVLLVGPVLVFGEVLLQVVCYGVGRALLPALTFGWMRAQSFGETRSFPWYGVSRMHDGTFIASAEASGVIGLLVIVAVVVASVLAYATSP